LQKRGNKDYFLGLPLYFDKVAKMGWQKNKDLSLQRVNKFGCCDSVYQFGICGINRQRTICYSLYINYSFLKIIINNED